jgi:pimeloyl-ACP methyl ester carboxylesterase
MTDWFSGDVIANGIRLHYYRTGRDLPPLVLSHGVTDSGMCWPRFAAALRDDYEIITYDSRGHGLSEAPECGYSADDRAADLAALIRALHLDKPRLLGHSMGGETTAYCAGNCPDLPRCAVLEDPPFGPDLYPPTQAERDSSYAGFRAMIEERRARPHATIVADGHAESPRWADEEFDDWATAKLRVSPFAANRRRDVPRRTWQQTIAAIECPVLLVTADPALGARITPAIAKEVAEVMRDGRIVNVPGAGHNIRRDQFGPFLAAVKGFLAGV